MTVSIPAAIIPTQSAAQTFRIDKTTARRHAKINHEVRLTMSHKS